jgi:hypothetical protein
MLLSGDPVGSGGELEGWSAPGGQRVSSSRSQRCFALPQTIAKNATVDLQLIALVSPTK